MEFHRPGREIYKSSGLSGKTPPTRTLQQTSKAFKLFQRNFHGLQNGLRGQKIIYRESRVPTIFGCFQNRATQHWTKRFMMSLNGPWTHVSSYNWHLNGVVFFLVVRMATPFDIFHSLHAHMKQLIIWVSLKGEKMPANERKFSDENQKENILLGKRQ